MKNYLLSFLYCLIYLAICVLGFLGLYTILDVQTYQIVVHTSLFFGIGMSFFLCVWFRQDELFSLLLFSLLMYIMVGLSNINAAPLSYYFAIAYPLICMLYPINVYLISRMNPNDSFGYSLLRNVFVLLCEMTVIYFFTYFIPVLCGSTFNEAFKQEVQNILYFPFGLDYTYPLPMVSIIIFLVCFGLMAKRCMNKIEQIQSAMITLFVITFLSLYFPFNPLIFHLCFLSGTACVLFTLLQVSHKMAFLDELTNIPGRRALMTELKQIDQQDYTLAMIDIDHFKRLNDSYGHEIGDQALRMISASLNQHSAEGMLYRYGGEEFVLLFPHRQLDEILDALESTRVLVSNSDFFLRPKTSPRKEAVQPYLASVKITLSVGVAEKIDGQNFDEVINIADQALYKAKQTGRNKTVYNKNGKFFELF